MFYTVEQNLVARHDGSNALVSACPGSGKTTTLVSLIKNLLDNDYDPKKILVMMFNTDAQKAFVHKLNNVIAGTSLIAPKIRTYHSIGFALCESLEKKGELPRMVLDPKEKSQELLAMSALKSVISPAQYKQLQNQNEKVVEVFVSFIDIVKSGLLSPFETFDNIGFNQILRKPFCDAFEQFENLRKQQGKRFFSDLLYDPVMLLLKRKDLREWLSNKKTHVIVDEFQDTNTIQYELLKIVAGTRANVIAVGDVKQSIYGWRGSDPQLMLSQFKKDFVGVKEFHLSYTFRYGHELSLVANSIISNNKESKNEPCISHPSTPKTTVDICSTDSPGKEALKIIKQEIKKGTSLNDMAVLCRLYSSATPIELELLSAGIPCGTSGGFSVLDTKELKAMRYILELASGKFEDLSQYKRSSRFESLFKFPHLGVKGEIVTKLADIVAKDKMSFGFSLRKAKIYGIKQYQANKLKDRGWIITHIESSGKKQMKASKLLRYYVEETDLFKSIKSMALSAMEATETIDRINFLIDYIEENDGTPSEVLAMLDKVKESSDKIKDTTSKVLISSIHKAKGLEWPVVIIPGLDDMRFPYKVTGEFKIDSPESEERRLFYVGITRAISNLYILAPEDRSLLNYLKTGDKTKNSFSMFGGVSKFLYETDLFVSKKQALSISKKERVEIRSSNSDIYVKKMAEIA